MQDTYDLASAVSCRICHSEEETGRPLFQPCKCTGSIGCVHQDCLTQWLLMAKTSSKDIERCEVCGEKLRWKRLYRSNAPQSMLSVTVMVVAVQKLLVPTFYKCCWFLALHSPTASCLLLWWIALNFLNVHGFDNEWFCRNWEWVLAIAVIYDWLIMRSALMYLIEIGINIISVTSSRNDS